MNEINYCRKAQKIDQSNQPNNDQNLKRHIAECAECQNALEVFVWMREFAERTAPPENLPAPGFLLFKARLIEKQSAATRAVQPIVRMQIASAAVFFLAIGGLLLKSRMPVGSLLITAFSSLVSLAPLLISSLTGAALICLAFAYFLRETKVLKKQ